MEPTGFNRKLAAILSADVKGYSRLMRSDEEATVRTLTEYRSIIINLVSKYHGRVVDSPGDNILAEFASVVHAVQCGFAIQTSLQDENTNLHEDRRMEFRIGINLGDVIQDGERIYGDGVNVAARMEALAEPGGICVSGSAYDQIETKVAFGCEYLGEQTVKNISTPIRVYRLTSDKTRNECTVQNQNRIQSKRLLFACVAGLLFLTAGGIITWKIYLNHSYKSIEPASVEPTDYPLPDKPSIAVLPFDNMSGDPSQEYIGDGLTEEIITALSKTPKLFVIARNSSFTYKDKSVSIPTVGKELGVRYVLEGSIQKAKEKVRINAQLIDAITGRHMWAEKYDRELKDIFALQDEITLQIISAVGAKLTRGERARIFAKGTNNLEAYQKVMQGWEYWYDITKENNLQARELAEEAIVLDPAYPDAYCLLAGTHWMEVYFGTTKSPKKTLEDAVKLYQKALAIDETHPIATGGLAYVYGMQRKYEEALVQAQRSIDLNPGRANPALGIALLNLGRYDESIQSFKKVIRLDPKGPAFYFHFLGHAYFGLEMYEKAIASYKKALDRKPDFLFAHAFLAAAYYMAGQVDKARMEAAEVHTIDPKFAVSEFGKSLHFKDQEFQKRVIESMRKASLPD
jgi:adenylate cyclase